VEVLEGIAEFFGIRPDYLTAGDNAYVRRIDDELAWLALSREVAVRELITALLDVPDRARWRLIDELA